MALLLVPVSAGAIQPREATQIALHVLEPKQERGVGAEVHVFATHGALPKGTVIWQAGGGVSKVKLRDPAYLYWEDLGYGQLFPHPSKLLMIDARTGDVAARRNFATYPLIDGKPLRFPRSADAYTNRPLAIAARKPDFSKDGLITVGQREDPAFTFDFNYASGLAKRLGIDEEESEPSGEGLEAAIRGMVEKGKTDIALFIGGHGYPEKDEYYTDKDGKRQLKAPGSDKPKLNLHVSKDGKYGESLTSTQLAEILKKFPNTKFKVIIDSCYSGRFIDDLEKLNGDKGPKNVAVGMTASNGKQPTYVGFWHALGRALENWTQDAAPTDTLEQGLRKAFKSDEVKRWAKDAGNSEPRITKVLPAPPPPPGPPCTSTLERSPGTEPYTAVNHIRVRAKCNQPIRKVVVRSLSGDTFTACAQTQGTGNNCGAGGETLTSVWNGPANEQLELYGRVAANADGNYHVQVLGAGDAVLLEYDATVSP